jgi:peptidoglycan/LPS O-acetylase OafA/YrhL
MWNGLGGYPALALLAASTFLAALAERNDQEATRHLKPFDAVANASFSIYLIHPVVASLMLGIVWRRILEPLDVVSYYAFWLAPMALTIALALLSARWFEAPLAAWLNERFASLSGQRRTPPPRATAARLPQ